MLKVIYRGVFSARVSGGHRGIGRRGGNLPPKRRAAFPFAIGGELSAISLRRRFVNASRKFCRTAIMKRLTSENWRAKLLSVLRARLTLENWRAKLMSVLLATMVWYLIKKNVATTPSPSETSSPAPVTETR